MGVCQADTSTAAVSHLPAVCLRSARPRPLNAYGILWGCLWCQIPAPSRHRTRLGQMNDFITSIITTLCGMSLLVETGKGCSCSFNSPAHRFLLWLTRTQRYCMCETAQVA